MKLELPELIDVSWSNYKEKLDDLYRIYISKIYNPDILINNKKITCRRDPLDEGKHECFWHLITNGKDARTPDIERCKRLEWCPYILKNYTNKEITCYEKNHKTGKGKQKRIFFWLPSEQYIIIIGESRNKRSYELVTAYFVNEQYYIRKFNEESKKSQDPRRAEAAHVSGPEKVLLHKGR